MEEKKDITPVIPISKSNVISLESRIGKTVQAYMGVYASMKDMGILDVLGGPKKTYVPPANSVEVGRDEYDLVVSMDERWARNFAETNNGIEYVGILKVKSAPSFVFVTDDGKYRTVNPTMRLDEIKIRYYLKVRDLSKKMLKHIVKSNHNDEEKS